MGQSFELNINDTLNNSIISMLNYLYLLSTLRLGKKIPVFLQDRYLNI